MKNWLVYGLAIPREGDWIFSSPKIVFAGTYRNACKKANTLVVKEGYIMLTCTHAYSYLPLHHPAYQ